MQNKNNILDIAYFSMEVALESDMSTYSGGLGVLAGDTLKTFADFGYSAVGITLLHEHGYVEQEFDLKGNQIYFPETWKKENYLTKLSYTIKIPFKDRNVICAVWEYEITGQFGDKVPVYFFDSNVPQNNKHDRLLTSFLYGGDEEYRICQEQILGVGGLMLLKKLKYNSEKVRVYHLNEGHASFVGLSLYRQSKKYITFTKKALEYVNSKLAFTTHTPIPAGHDRFLMTDVEKVLPGELIRLIPKEALIGDRLCMTRLSLYFSGAINGVAVTHEKVTEKMFPEHDVIPVTNGAHHLEWTHPNFKKLYDKYIPEWRQDPGSLRKAMGIPDDKIWETHVQTKKKLIKFINTILPNKFSEDVFTLGYARRFTSYKRPTLILDDLERLEKMISIVGKLQIVFTGKSHPRDKQGAGLIKEVFHKIQNHKGKISIVFLEDYDMKMAIKLVGGVDTWLNTPLQKHEASGTSGMKAAFNAIPHLSVLDGWWPEGSVEGVTGWSIGTNKSHANLDDKNTWSSEVSDLYHKIAKVILPMYYGDRASFINIMKNAVALNGSYFNTYRMMNEYVSRVFFPLGNKFVSKNMENKYLNKSNEK